MISRAAICKSQRVTDTYGMETNRAFIDLLRLLADFHVHPDPGALTTFRHHRFWRSGSPVVD